MSKQLRCMGGSDDTFGVYFDRVQGEDYDNCASGKPIIFRVKAAGESLLVFGQYAPGPCAGWMIGVAPDDSDDAEEKPIPNWPMHFERSSRPYSPMLVIEVPDDFTIRLAHAED